MRDELQLFVNENFSLEKQFLIKKAFSIFEDYELGDYDTPFMELLSEFDSKDYFETLLEFENLIRNTLLTVLKEHAIILNEECDLETIIEISSGIHEIQYYEDKETILRIIETDYSDEEKLATLLNLVTLLSVDKILINIEQLDNNIFNLIVETCAYSDSVVVDPVEISKAEKAIIKNIKMFRDFTSKSELIGFKIIEKGFTVNLSFDFYYRYLKHMLKDVVDSKAIALEYFLILMMSKESHLNPINYFRKISTNITEDIGLITKIDIELNKLYNDFDKYKLKFIFIDKNIIAIDSEYEIVNVPSDLPIGEYKGKISGYNITFNFNNVEYSLRNRIVDTKDPIDCTVIKHSNGLLTVEK